MSVVKSADELGELGEQELEELYTWIDGIPLSRPKRNIARDFSDGVLVAELVHHYFPKEVQLHNYTSSNSTKQKLDNWYLLNRKVFKKLRFELAEDVIRQILNAQPGVIERLLQTLRTRLERVGWERKQQAQRTAENEQPEADQNTYQKVSPRRGPSKVEKEKAANTGPYRGMNAGTLRSKTDDSVPLILLEEKAQEVLAKDETIQILQAKIKRLEHLLHLKDIRIEDLQSRLEASRPTGKR